MQIQVSTDNHIDGREALERWAEGELTDKLSHHAQDITRIEVHLSLVTGKGPEEHRCVMEARMANMTPMAVSQQASSQDESFRGALAKLKHAIETTIGRQRSHRDRESIRRDVDPPL